ncbi:hypothetical protein D3C81_1013730 [compost metagenome]
MFAQLAIELFQLDRLRAALAAGGEDADTPEQRLALPVVQLDAQLAVAAAHHVGAGMLAQHQAVAAPQFVGVQPLVVAPVLEQAIDVDARLVGEHPGADHALLPGHLTSGGLLDQRRDRRDAARVDAGIDAVQMLEGQRALLQRRIAGTLAQTVDRGVEVGRAAQHRRQGVGGGQAEVVVGVHLQLEVEARAQEAKALEHAERLHHPHGVGEAQAPRAGRLGHLGDAHHEVHVGPRGILAAEAHLESGQARRADQPRHLAQGPVAVAAELVPEHQVGDRQRQIDHAHPAVAGRGEIAVAQPAPGQQARRQLEGGDGAHALALLLAHAGDADLQLRHAQLGERAGDGDLLLGTEGHAGALLTVAQGGVVDDHAGHGFLQQLRVGGLPRAATQA